MSLYRDAIAQATGGRSAPLQPIPVQLVKVAKVVPTPHGNVVSGEVVEGEYFPPGYGADSGHEIGWSLKKAIKKVGKGVARGAKAVAKAPKKVAKGTFRATKAVGKGAIKVTKKTGKTVLKGSTKAVKWVAKNPIKAVALAAAPVVALPAYAAYKGVKAIAKAGKGGQQAALPPMEEEPTAEPSYEEPESYPGEVYEGTEETEQPDVLSPADEGEYSEEEYSDEEGSYSEEEGADETDNVSGERDMNMREEWVGLEEIAGEEIAGDDDYDVGAALPKRKPGPNAVKVRNTGYTKQRRQYVAVDSGADIAAGASQSIVVSPQTLFRGRKLVLSDTVAAAFVIDDIKVGTQSQAAAAGQIPGDAFRGSTTGEDNIQMDTARPGQAIIFQVTNISGGAVRFRAALFGDSVQ